MKTVLFDLDGTLLPMDQEYFTKEYFKALTKTLSPYGYGEKELEKGVWAGTGAMVKNDGSRLNCEAFYKTFGEYCGERVVKDKPLFDAFYEKEFDSIRFSCGFDPESGKTVAALRERGYGIVLATNPIFPMSAQRARMRWAGLDERDFTLVTSYENSRFCKPNPDYYREILEKLDLAPEDCVMAGNDYTEDYAALEVGIPVFILTKCLINRENKDLSGVPHGGFVDLISFIERVLPLNAPI